MIDPQMQAYNWIKGKEPGIPAIKPTTDPSKLMRILRVAITEGQAVLFADANEEFDPVIEPILGKKLEK